MLRNKFNKIISFLFKDNFIRIISYGQRVALVTGLVLRYLSSHLKPHFIAIYDNIKNRCSVAIKQIQDRIFTSIDWLKKIAIGFLPYVLGLISFIITSWISTWLTEAKILVPTMKIPEDYSVLAWSYIGITVGILSIIYPLSLNIRESLISRIINSLDDLLNVQNRKKHINSEAAFLRIQKYIWPKLQKFRREIFDYLLPSLAIFTISSVARILINLMGVNIIEVKFLGYDIFSKLIEVHFIEPHLYIIAYILWIIAMAGSILRHRPVYYVEKAETIIVGVSSIEDGELRKLKPEDLI